MRIDLTLIRDRLVCAWRGTHLLPVTWKPMTPWDMPRCARCGSRFRLPTGPLKVRR